MVRQLDRAAEKEKNPELQQLLQSVKNTLRPYHSDGRVLTDDRAPVEFLGMQTLDGLIREEVGTYRRTLRKKGIRGLLEE